MGGNSVDDTEPLESMYLKEEEETINFPRSLEDRQLMLLKKSLPSELIELNKVRRSKRTAPIQRKSSSREPNDENEALKKENEALQKQVDEMKKTAVFKASFRQKSTGVSDEASQSIQTFFEKKKTFKIKLTSNNKENSPLIALQAQKIEEKDEQLSKLESQIKEAHEKISLLERAMLTLMSKSKEEDPEKAALRKENQYLKECMKQRTIEANEAIRELASQNQLLEKQNAEYLSFIGLLSEEVVKANRLI